MAGELRNSGTRGATNAQLDDGSSTTELEQHGDTAALDHALGTAALDQDGRAVGTTVDTMEDTYKAGLEKGSGRIA